MFFGKPSTMSYMLPDRDMPIAEANYMSLYGATHHPSLWSIEAAAEEAQALSMYNLNTHDTLRGTSLDSIANCTSTAEKTSGSIQDGETDATVTMITHQSVDEALFELKYRHKKGVMDGSNVSFGKSPIYSAIFNMLAGCGVVGLPVTYKNGGLFAGVTMMICVAVLSVFTLRLQIQTGKKVNCQDYERLVSKCFGIWGYYLISFNILIFDIGACLTYTIILGDSARDVMDYLLGGFWGSFESRQILIFAIYICLILPCCLGKNFEFIEKVSALAIMVVILMTIVVIQEYYQTYQYDNIDINPSYYDKQITVWITNDYLQILAALGTISFAFIQHDLAFLVYKTLKNNTLERYTILSFLGMAMQCILCVLMAVYGYLSFGNYTHDDILTNYPIQNKYVLAIRILYTFRMAFVFPTAFYVVRHILYAIIFRGMETYEHATRIKQVIFTVIPWSAFLMVGLFLDDLGFVMSLSGLLSALNVAFVLPCLCHLKVGTPYSIFFWTAPSGQICYAFLDTFPCILLIVFGILAGVTGSIGLIAEKFGKL